MSDLSRQNSFAKYKRGGVGHQQMSVWPILMSVWHCSPDAADSSTFDVQLGDIILTATDGLFDNMPDYMILRELQKLKVSQTWGTNRFAEVRNVCGTQTSCLSCFSPQNANYESIQQIARSIAEQAHDLAYDPNYMSPFAQFACDNGLNVRGKWPNSTWTRSDSDTGCDTNPKSL